MKFVRKTGLGADHVFKDAKHDYNEPLDVEMTAASSRVAQPASVCASDSASSLASNDSSVSSSKNRPESRRHFLEMIEKAEFEILSRKSKYRLKNAEGALVFCEFENS